MSLPFSYSLSWKCQTTCTAAPRQARSTTEGTQAKSEVPVGKEARGIFRVTGSQIRSREVEYRKWMYSGQRMPFSLLVNISRTNTGVPSINFQFQLLIQLPASVTFASSASSSDQLPGTLLGGLGELSALGFGPVSPYRKHLEVNPHI